MTLLALVKSGYGTVTELNKLDTTDYLDLVEFESISRAIEKHVIDRGS